VNRGDDGTKKDKGDAAYCDIFDALLGVSFSISENAALTGGLGLNITSWSQLSAKDPNKGKAATITETTFYIPLSVSVKF
jgi:hypothetical protein